jgi:hypothetical protein
LSRGAVAFVVKREKKRRMRTRALWLIEWILLTSPSLLGTACGGEDVQFTPSQCAGGTGGAGATGGSGGAAGTGGASGSGGAAGTGGASGSGGAAGTGGEGGASGAAGSGGGSGGSDATGGGAGNSGASGAGGTSGAAGGGGAAGGRDDAGPDEDASTEDVASDGDATIDPAIDAGCPQIFGTYAINNANGMCGDLVDNAPQEIRGSACALQFISVGADGGIGAINGSATLGADGTFSGATLIEGTVPRTPCRGSWSETEQEMTVICGTSADECLVELRRNGP